MAFLDNSGDIILDAVLTDAGRYRLAKGDGSFRIEKFALGDDEIDYSLYNNQDSRGSAYYDIDILSTPILEAFTDNMSSMKSKLISIPRNNLLYLPTINLNEKFPSTKLNPLGTFMVAVDDDTEKAFTLAEEKTGVLFGISGGDNNIRLDQGLDTTEIPPIREIDSDLRETQFIIEIDNRLGSIMDRENNRAAVSYIDDDNVASYYFTANTDENFIEVLSPVEDTTQTRAIRGPQGAAMRFRIASSLELQTSPYLFEKLGDTFDLTLNVGTTTFYFIDTVVKVTGATTGSKVDIPVRFIKLQ
jgi:hypothetical protein